MGQWEVDYDEAIWACEEAIRIIEKLNQDNENDTGVEKRLEDLTTTMLGQMDEKMKDTYGVTITNLAQLATSADPNAVAEIISLLEELRQAFIDARDSQSGDEANAIDNFNTSTGNLEEAIRLVEEEIRGYETQ